MSLVNWIPVKLQGRPKTVIESFHYSVDSLEQFLTEVAQADDETSKLLLKYPTVYVIYQVADGGYRVYVGETNNIAQRTRTHLEADPEKIDLVSRDLDAVLDPVEDNPGGQPSHWNVFRDSDSTILVIGHSLFNKSLTLDIEDRLMLYLSSADGVKGASSVRLANARRNTQTDYFTKQYVDETFHSIWRGLRKHGECQEVCV